MKLLYPFQYTIVILYFLFHTSCVSIDDDSSLMPVNIEEKTTDNIYYSMFVDSIAYLNLEPNELVKLSEITDVIVSDSYIYILDEHIDKILAYRSDGSFAFIIDKKGKANDEYINLAQFDFDKENRQLVLLDM